MIFLQPLNEKEEKELLERIESGEEEAKHLMVEHNMRLVAHIAKRYRLAEIDTEDVLSIGTIGLIKAVQTFDLSKQVKFATYASRCINNEILMHIRKNKHKNQEKYLEEVIRQDGQGVELTLSDTIGTSKQEVEETMEHKEDMLILFELMNKLSPKERLIIEYRFGINREKKKQEDIAKEFDISQSYVSRIEGKALKKMRMKYQRAVI